MQRCLILSLVVQMSKTFSISSYFKPIDVVTPVAQYIPPTSRFFYLLYEISAVKALIGTKIICYRPVLNLFLISEKPEKRDLALELRQAFHQYDPTGKGLIPTTEVCRMFKNLGQVSRLCDQTV